MISMIKGGTTVLFVSHTLEQIKSICDRVIWLDHGELIMDGKCKEVCDAYSKSQR